jgi:glycerol-3-phosphate dehydrogenase
VGLAEQASFDLIVVGGGINGVAIARDAAGRGLAVLLIERGDLAGATSSASSKLIHGGLRYLEQRELRLVRESLAEREVLLAAAPHLVRPLRFVLPVHRGLRPAWLLRLGLLLYDSIGGRVQLPATRTVRRGRDAALDPLLPAVRLGFEYWDCKADDARLVIANALDAQERAAQIEVRTGLLAAHRAATGWQIEYGAEGASPRRAQARALVNATGPWVEQIQRQILGHSDRTLRLVKGSHIVVPRLYAGDSAYTLQQPDRRIVFVIPYEEEFTLIGTTDVPFEGDPSAVAASAAEIEYLCASLPQYLRVVPRPKDVRWAYSGVRPLYDSGQISASTVTRDYVFHLDAPAGLAPLLSVYGGKLTTHRRLAEHALAELLPRLNEQRAPWTRGAILPGGDLATEPASFLAEQLRAHPWAPEPLVRRYCRAYGTRIERILRSARATADLGAEIAPGLYEAELDYRRAQEWARTADDVLWRRSKLGLRLDAPARGRIEDWLARAR